MTRPPRADPFLRDHPPVVELVGGRFSSARVAADHPLPVSLGRCRRGGRWGGGPHFIGEPYGADMRLLVNEGRTPTVIFGPGHINRAHVADEAIPLDDVVACARVLAAWVVTELASRG